MNDDQILDEVAVILSGSIRESQMKIVLQSIKELGLYEEFEKFYLTRWQERHIFDIFVEFGRLHPDKFHIPDQTESYGHFVVIDRNSVTPPTGTVT